MQEVVPPSASLQWATYPLKAAKGEPVCQVRGSLALKPLLK
jgi:hypothetical protein